MSMFMSILSVHKCAYSHACVRAVIVCVRKYVCMIIISPYLLRHWLRLKGDELPSAMVMRVSVRGSVGVSVCTYGKCVRIRE